ncbi:MAG TPA: ATP-binding protein [Methanosarcina sp.]|jgi:hypothetical protein|nr:ATP-binding protein [Methanosarcina sp.]
MSDFNPFDEKHLGWIFEKVDSNSINLIRRESTTLEFKQNFNFGSITDYGKIGASFANRKGGYLVFGINDKNRAFEGMKDDQFERLDVAKIGSKFDEYFQPSIKWDSYVYNLEGKKAGIIYFFESKDKPIISTKNDSRANFSEGSIFYRYGGQVNNIRFPELNTIIHSKIENERISWQRFLSQVIQIKPEKALILDLDRGIISEGDQKIIIDESIIDKFKFIKEGEFNEKSGAPTLKLVGTISNISAESGKIIEKPVPTPYAITADRIFEAFFTQSCDHPFEFISSFCHESSPNLPMWFFLSKSGKSIHQVEDIWSSFKDAKKYVRRHLIKRLTDDNDRFYAIAKIHPLEEDFSLTDIGIFNEYVESIKNRLKLTKRSNAMVERSIVYSAVISGHTDIITNLIETNPRPVFEAISHLPSNYISENKDWILKSLKTIYSLNLDNSYKTGFRKAVCSVDIKLYHPNYGEISLI